MRQTVILIAEEDVCLAEAIAADCVSEGWQAISVSTGDQAIKFVHEKKPDLIILSTAVHGTNGLEVCRHVAAITKTPVIMLSSFKDARIRAKCLKYGAEDYIVKPFKQIDLMQRIKKILIPRRVKHLARQPSLAEKQQSLQACIDALRAKIELDPENPTLIVTVPGVGYRFGSESMSEKQEKTKSSTSNR